MTGRTSHWTERGDDNIFFTFGHCGTFVPSQAANVFIVMAPSCVNSLYPSAKESWEEMTKIESKNKMLYSPGSDQRPGRPVILIVGQSSTPNMTGRRFHRTTEWIPRHSCKAKTPLLVTIKTGTRGVRMRYDTVLLPFISIVQCPCRPVIPVPANSLRTTHELEREVFFLRWPLEPKTGTARTVPNRDRTKLKNILKGSQT